MLRFNPSLAFLRLCWLAGVIFLCVPGAWSAEEETRNKGLFLVATEQLSGTGFHETVILITHYSPHGASGIAINRPTDIPLREALPEIGPLQQSVDPLFLGGPVSANVISVLVRTLHPVNGMQHIAANLYFASGQTALAQPIDGTARIYAGYTGWAPGQLQAEVERGDWVVIEIEPDIIFEEDTAVLWRRLHRLWSGNWI
jgi:putative transcriptional regulator